jgi:hypothetical protein
MFWVRLPLRTRCTTLCDDVCQWLVAGQWFSLGPLLSSTDKTDHHDIAEILLNVALNTIKPLNQPSSLNDFSVMQDRIRHFNVYCQLIFWRLNNRNKENTCHIFFDIYTL